jgi:hypothetical protein
MTRTGRNALVVALAVLALAGCSGSSDGKKNASVDTRPSQTPSTGAGVNFDTPPTTVVGSKKSQPYWVPVTTLDGTGATTTKSFTIADGAIQWKVGWHCDAAPFTVVSVNASGQESRRKLADALSCPKDGEGFATDKGSQTLKVTTSGPWKLTVEQQVDTPLVEPLPANLTSAKVVATAKVYNVDREGQGVAKIYERADGTRAIRLEDFFVTINSDLEIRLSSLETPKSTDEIAKAPFKVVAPLKATVGDMNYEVPKDIDVSQFKSIVIWCEITRNAYAAATIQKA